jgi:hypothetical protein
MLTYVALAIRVFGVFSLAKAALWAVDLGRVLFWNYDSNQIALAHVGEGYTTPLSLTQLNTLMASYSVESSYTLGWLFTAHTVGWFLLGCACWSLCVEFARLLLKNIPGT